MQRDVMVIINDSRKDQSQLSHASEVVCVIGDLDIASSY